MPDAPVPDLVDSERDVLVHYLNKMRNAVVQTSEGLTDEQQRAAGVPSGTNLLGIIQHLADHAPSTRPRLSHPQLNRSQGSPRSRL